MRPETGLQRKIWDIALPAIISNISIPLLGLVDTAILGHLEHTRYLGAVAVGAAVLSFLYWGFSFLRMGTTGLVARAVGAGNREREKEVLLQSLILALVLALLVMLTHRLWLTLGLGWMAAGPDLTPLAESYARIRIYSAPAVLMTYAVIGWFIGRQNMRWPLVIVVSTNLINVALDLLFVVVLDWKSDGAAYATVGAEYCGLAIAALVMLRQQRFHLGPEQRARLLRWQRYRELLNSNRYLFIRTSCLLFSFAFFTSQSASFGEDQLAANTIILNLLLFAAYGLDGFAYAAEALSGSAAGAGRLDLFYSVVWACSAWSLLSAAALSGLFGWFGGELFSLFTSHQAVVALLLEYQPWLVALPLIAAASYLLDGIFIGTARTRYMMWTMVASLLLVYLPAWYLLQPWGNHGLWAAFLLFNGARGVSLGLCYWQVSRRHGWLDPAG